ncbi:phage terminase small subunit P27 family [Brevundimonas vesicularis]|uniref:phage terminase small subunit P27 family n=2 Tax=Brevundimonas TaxID=41275 RepID=UPI00157247E0|nr:phage terminase small subunit P27 family [Brevundimonas vesicularis]NSX32780.1 phage terminase small subunit P27 family [Brevundimonas vesicularis]
MTINNAGYLKAPAQLSKQAKKVWSEQVKAQPEGYFTPADGPSLEALVTAICSLRDANRTLEENGSMYSVGSQGQLIIHPAARIQNDAIRLINQTSQRLAIDPTSRKAQSGQPADDDAGEIGGLLA